MLNWLIHDTLVSRARHSAARILAGRLLLMSPDRRVVKRQGPVISLWSSECANPRGDSAEIWLGLAWPELLTSAGDARGGSALPPQAHL